MNRVESAVRSVLGAVPLELIRESGSTVYRAAGVGIVRVERDGLAQIAVARALHSAGAPVPGLLGDACVVGGLTVSIWEDVADDGSLDARAMGSALRSFQEVGTRLDVLGAITLGRFDPVGWLTRRLEGATTDLARALLDRAGSLALPPGETVLHTDAHAGNFRVSGGRAVLVDLEQVALGPALYDLAALEVTERRFRGDRAIFERFAAAFGADPADPALAQLIALREVLAVGFVAGLGHLDVARNRLAQLDDRAARWDPF